MKKIFYISAILLLAVSCKDFLNKPNPYKIESEYYFTDESSLEIYTNGLIRSFDLGLKSLFDGDRYSDTNVWDGEYAFYTDKYTANDATNWTTSNWSQLRSINYYLDHMHEASASEAIMNHYEGVGRFFRAYFYFVKMQTFGAVPVYTTSIDPSDRDALYKGRDSREDVFKQILADINYACDNCLADAKYRNHCSYIHKYVALAYKVRFCLYEGTFRKYHSVDPSTGLPWKADESEAILRECIKAAEELMESGVYGLIDNAAARKTQYRAMFTAENGVVDCAKEWIWARDNDETLNVKDLDYSVNDYFVNAQHGQYQHNRGFINQYLMLDGTPFISKYPDPDQVDFITECKDRDYRLAQTIRTADFTRDKGTKKVAPDLTYAKSGYQSIKYLLDDSTYDPQGMKTYTDVPMMRYAEVLLSYAEAKAELGECTQAVWDKTIKPLRERAGVKSIYPTSADPYMVKYFMDKVTDPVILEIRRERGIEYVMEYLRFNDLMRWHMGDLLDSSKNPWKGIYIPQTDAPIDLNGDGVNDSFVTSNASASSSYKILLLGQSGAMHQLAEGNKGVIKPFTGIARKWEDKKYLKPVPSIAITENGNLSQNPGWELE